MVTSRAKTAVAMVSGVIPRPLKAEITYLEVLDALHWSEIVTEALETWLSSAVQGDVRIPAEPMPTLRKGDPNFLDVQAKVPRPLKARVAFMVIQESITWADVLTKALADWLNDYRIRREENDEGQTQGDGSEEG